MQTSPPIPWYGETTKRSQGIEHQAPKSVSTGASCKPGCSLGRRVRSCLLVLMKLECLESCGRLLIAINLRRPYSIRLVTRNQLLIILSYTGSIIRPRLERRPIYAFPRLHVLAFEQVHAGQIPAVCVDRYVCIAHDPLAKDFHAVLYRALQMSEGPHFTIVSI